MKQFTAEMLAIPLFEKMRKRKGLTPEEFLEYMNTVVAPGLERREKLFEEFIKTGLNGQTLNIHLRPSLYGTG